MPKRIGNSNRRRRHFVKEWREFRSLTQQDLANDVGTTKSSISRIEDGTSGYTQDSLEAIADALGTTVGALLERRPTMTDTYSIPTERPARAKHRA